MLFRSMNHSDVQTLKSSQRRIYLLRAIDHEKAGHILTENGCDFTRSADGAFEVPVLGGDIDRFIKIIASIELRDLDVKNQSLEDIFMTYYGKGGEVK